MMQRHRLQSAHSLVGVYDFRPGSGFSAFDFIRKQFKPHFSRTIRRCFSLARALKCETLVVEEIDCIGLLESEYEEILEYGGHTTGPIYRVSFWNTFFTHGDEIDSRHNSDLIGYAIIKCDGVIRPDKSGINATHDEWYIFESVFVKYDHANNCVPYHSSYDVTVGRKQFVIEGVLFCQQNAINKVCAHVALRSVLSRVMPQKDISYKEINEYAALPFGGWEYSP